MLDWEEAFSNKTINKQKSFMNEALINIFINFITKYDNNPPWINDYGRNKVNWKNEYLQFICQKRSHP